MPGPEPAAGMGSIEDLEAANEEVPLMTGAPAESGSSAEQAANSPRGIPSSLGNCRICLETSPLEELEDACACKGSLQRVHHACLQRWIDERDLPRNSTGQALVCEICKTPYKSGYRAPPPRPEPSRMPRRIERVMVGQDLYVIVVDPQTGMATVRPTGGGLHDYEDSDEDDPRRLNMSPMSACIFSFFLFVMSSLLLSHLFTALPGPSVEPGSIPSPMDDEQADEQFQDLSMTLLLLWLMLRLLVLVAPVYTISRIFERARLARLRANSSAGESENDGVELRAVVVEAPPPSAGLAAVEVPPGRS